MYNVCSCILYNVQCTLSMVYIVPTVQYRSFVLLYSRHTSKQYENVAVRYKYVCLDTSVQSPIVFILCTVGTRWDASLVFQFCVFLHTCTFFACYVHVCLYVSWYVCT